MIGVAGKPASGSQFFKATSSFVQAPVKPLTPFVTSSLLTCRFRNLCLHRDIEYFQCSATFTPTLVAKRRSLGVRVCSSSGHIRRCWKSCLHSDYLIMLHLH
uniref:Uncharacterized protein n=1 Tax=Cacopsylla melanoneura TaxID=428564 RepID=A0A8D8Y569_9HEMI